MRIDSSYRTGALANRTPARGAAGTFQLSGQAPTARAAAPMQAAMAQGLDALLALQAVEDPMQRRRKAVRRGRSLLDTLDALKTDLLGGRMGDGRLNQLMAVIGQARERGDADLDALIDDIELRARVELAKRGLFPAF